MWRGRHVVEPTELDPDEATAYWLEMLRVAKALQRHYRLPAGAVRFIPAGETGWCHQVTDKRGSYWLSG